MMKLSLVIALFVATAVDVSSGRLSPGHTNDSSGAAPPDDAAVSSDIKRGLRNLQGQKCGGGNVGNGACADSSSCCSQWGWCGTTPDHCQGGGAGTPPASPKLAPATGGSGGTPCGGGTVGNGVCSGSNIFQCCSQWGWCGSSADHCGGSGGGSPPPPPTPASSTPAPVVAPAPTPAPVPAASGGGPPPGGGEPAYLTYHLYYEDQSLLQVSCSDGTNGLVTRWDYDTLQPLWPYVAAVSNLQWNSPVCGTCYELYASSTDKTVYVTAIDQVGNPGPKGELHFDVAQPAFDELLGPAGYRDGNGDAAFREVDASYCRGNNGK